MFLDFRSLSTVSFVPALVPGSNDGRQEFWMGFMKDGLGILGIDDGLF